MNHSHRRPLALLLALALAATLPIPTSALFRKEAITPPKVEDFSKNGLIGSILTFEAEDFVVQRKNKATLNSITLGSLPDPGAGTLTMGGRPLEVGTVVDRTALAGLRFQSNPAPTVTTTTFTFTPTFSSGQESPVTTVTLHLLTQENRSPIARNMDLTTYENIAITGYFDALDGEGDLLTFRLTSTPARGAVDLAEDGSSQFVYTPYENKTGRDTFTYVATDPAGNTSAEGTITVRIEKADTRVTYADLEGHSAHKAAIRLAEEGLCVGRYVDGRYFFDPDAPASRAQFLTMAMAATGLEAMEGVTLTGFADDDAIPTWAKGSVSAALKAGVIQGSRDEEGAPVFQARETITLGEATIMVNNLLNLSDVPAQVFFANGRGHWAGQAAANLAASGVVQAQSLGTLSQPLTMAEAAELLDGTLDVVERREGGNWFW